jgi:uncharacterized protein YlxW (UPF0749 family)
VDQLWQFISPLSAVGLFYMLNKAAINNLIQLFNDMQESRNREELTRRDREKEVQAQINSIQAQTSALRERISRMEGKADDK